MTGNILRKLLATMLALIIILPCTAASAGAVNVELSVDTDTVKEALANFGLQDDLMNSILDFTRKAGEQNLCRCEIFCIMHHKSPIR